MKKLTTKEDISNLLSASTASIALGAAIETGLFQMLAEKPMDGMGIARALSIPGKRCHYWLQMLEELGVLVIDNQGYVPSDTIRAVMVEGNRMDWWKIVAADEREYMAGVRNLAEHLSEPGSIWRAQGLAEPMGYVEKMSKSPERARVFTRLLYDLHQDLGKDLAEVLDLSGVERMMDVGGSSGVVCMPLVRKYPGLRVEVVEIENVCNAGREIVEENLLSDRISFCAADFVADELPQGFDMVLHCDIGVFGVNLFRKLWASLIPGGRIVVIFHFPAAENAAPAPYLRWALRDSLIDPEFGFPTVAQIRDQLVQAGFQPLPGEHTLPQGHIVVQARKV